MLQENKTLTGEYRHIRVKKTILVKQIVGQYAVLEVDYKQEVVVRKEDLFDNYNQVRHDIPTTKIQ